MSILGNTMQQLNASECLCINGRPTGVAENDWCEDWCCCWCVFKLRRECSSKRTLCRMVALEKAAFPVAVWLGSGAGIKRGIPVAAASATALIHGAD